MSAGRLRRTPGQLVIVVGLLAAVGLGASVAPTSGDAGLGGRAEGLACSSLPPFQPCGTITAVLPGSGVVGGGSEGEVTVGVDFDVAQRRVAACPAGNAIREVAPSGEVVCEATGSEALFDRLLVASRIVSRDFAVCESFDGDVFGPGSWSRSHDSVGVAGGVLRIGPGAGTNDWARLGIDVAFPLLVEARMKLVEGGNNYRLPYLVVYDGPGEEDGLRTIYLSNKTSEHGGWHFGDWPHGWTFSDTAAPAGEDTWATVRGVLREDGGQLLAKPDGDGAFTSISSVAWSVGPTAVRLGLEQPWDATVEVDYVKVLPLVSDALASLEWPWELAVAEGLGDPCALAL